MPVFTNAMLVLICNSNQPNTLAAVERGRNNFHLKMASEVQMPGLTVQCPEFTRQRTTLHGYLAHKKSRAPWTLQRDYA